MDLKSFVLIDLKIGELKHQDLGQMQMYVNYYDRYEKQDFENPTISSNLISSTFRVFNSNSEIIMVLYQLLFLKNCQTLDDKLFKENQSINLF